MMCSSLAATRSQKKPQFVFDVSSCTNTNIADSVTSEVVVDDFAKSVLQRVTNKEIFYDIEMHIF